MSASPFQWQVTELIIALSLLTRFTILMASSGRYQSRLFNFVRQQSRRLTEQCDRAFRHLQVSASWGMQLILYPVYVLFKSKTTPDKQLEQMQQSWSQLPDTNIAEEEFSRQLPPDDANSTTQLPPTADTPICGEPLREMSSPLEYDLSNYQALTFLDRSIADLESNYLAPVSKAAITLAQRSWKLVLRVQTQLTSFGGTQPANSKSPTNVTDAHTLRIQALIWAAIDYFFGRRSRKQLGQTTPINNLEQQAGSTRRRLLPRRIISSKVPSAQLRPQLTSFDVDPWLTLNDLFGEPELEGSPSTQQILGLSNQTMSQIAGKTNPPLYSSKLSGYCVWRNRIYLQGLPQSKQVFRLVKRQKTTKGMTVVGKGLEKVESKPLSPLPKSSRSMSNDERFNQPCTQLAPAPDWIETNATMMGYVKHPLEQLLDWLDRVMLYLEDFLLVVWRWIQQLLRAVNPS